MEIIIITIKIASQLELSQQFCPRLQFATFLNTVLAELESFNT